MADWVIIQSPASMLLLGIAVFFNWYDRRYKSTKGVFSLISAVCAIAAISVLCFAGAGLRELASVGLVFLLLNIGENI